MSQHRRAGRDPEPFGHSCSNLGRVLKGKALAENPFADDEDEMPLAGCTGLVNARQHILLKVNGNLRH
ncbi:hypothetical protein SDC9_69638 [bioreactor metagenome]|uniref:Uncharacterized protein n=1 Tax=bioreactor metagenome TaxID=1076179 RepID=A0A644YAM2_9ZZZZ